MKEKFQKILESMNKKGQTPVALFALLKMDDLDDKWTVIYADESELMDSQKKNEIFGRLLDEIKKELSSDELNLIARVGVFMSKDHLIQALLKYQSRKTIFNEKVNGNFVHEGYIFKAVGDGEQNEKASSPFETDLKAGDKVSKSEAGK